MAGRVRYVAAAAMDTLTHALSGALLARATTPKQEDAQTLPRRLLVGVLAAAVPDLDFATVISHEIPS